MRYGKNKDGSYSPCRAKPENVGRYGCTHSNHVDLEPAEADRLNERINALQSAVAQNSLRRTPELKPDVPSYLQNKEARELRDLKADIRLLESKGSNRLRDKVNTKARDWANEYDRLSPEQKKEFHDFLNANLNDIDPGIASNCIMKMGVSNAKNLLGPKPDYLTGESIVLRNGMYDPNHVVYDKNHPEEMLEDLGDYVEDGNTFRLTRRPDGNVEAASGAARTEPLRYYDDGSQSSEDEDVFDATYPNDTNINEIPEVKDFLAGKHHSVQVDPYTLNTVETSNYDHWEYPDGSSDEDWDEDVLDTEDRYGVIIDDNA